MCFEFFDDGCIAFNEEVGMREAVAGGTDVDRVNECIE